MTHFDRRLTPARSDLAAAFLRGQVEAARFVEGKPMAIIASSAPLRREPRADCGIDTEAIHGEAVTVYDEQEGWAWVQLQRDGYVGWLSVAALDVRPSPTHWVRELRTFVYPTPSIKQPPIMALTFGSQITAMVGNGPFVAVEGGGFVFGKHTVPIDYTQTDPVAVAEHFLGVPYLWGGKTSLGIDCSGLVQTALQACGFECPRDSDMQEGALGTAIDPGKNLENLKRGDLLFWKGHVAQVRDAKTMIHATGHTMTVIVEGLREGIERIAAAGDELRTVKRLTKR